MKIGNRIKHTNLSKSIALFSIILIVLCFSACTKEEDTANTKLLYEACMASDYEKIQELVKKDDVSLDNCSMAEENDGDKRILEAVINATSIIDEKTCSLLIEAGAELDGKDEYGETYLQELIDLNSLGNGQSIDLLNMMLKAGADINIRGDNEYNVTAFEYLMDVSPLACKDFEKMCKIFTENMDEISQKTLSQALQKEARLEAAPIILEALDKSGQSIDVISPLLAAVVKSEDDETIMSLIKNKSYDEKEMQNIVVFAAANCSVKVMEALDTTAFDIYCHIGENEMSALDVAAAYNDEKMISYLLDKGLDLKESDSNYDDEVDNEWVEGYMQSSEILSYTPISMALVRGRADNVEFLLKKNTDFQENSWCIACIYGNKVSIDILLDNNFRQQKEYIYRAYLSSDKDTVKYMLDKGISYDVSEYGEPLMDTINENNYLKPLGELIKMVS